MNEKIMFSAYIKHFFPAYFYILHGHV